MDVAKWLQEIGAGQYAALFRDNDIDAPLLASLTSEDLREIGVASVGHRRLILNAIAVLSEAPPEAPGASPGQRRPVTVLFADLCGFTQLSGELEDEALHDVILRYLAMADAAVKDCGGVVLQDIEKLYPTSAKCQDAIKPLLADNRKPVIRKAARVLGVLNAPVSEADLKNIAGLLKGTDKYETIDGLKALRGLKAQSTILEITPLLQNPDKNVIRDACRTLAVLGDKSLIPTIKPLLDAPDLAVQKDAADAIAILKEK